MPTETENVHSRLFGATGKAIATLRNDPNDVGGEVYRIITKNAALALADGIATSRDDYSFAVEYANSLIRSDYTKVLELARVNNWNDETPVKPEIFGTLWFDGMPDEWIREFPISTGATPQYQDGVSLAKTGAELVRSLNRYYVSHGEQPISLDDPASFGLGQPSVAV